MTYDSDTEVIMHFLSREVQSHKPEEDLNFTEIFKNLLTDFDGSWNIAFLNADGKMVAVRDPLGLKPMCWGVSKDDVLVFSSESVVLSNLQIEAHDLKPGEMLIVEGAQGCKKEKSGLFSAGYMNKISVVPYTAPVSSSYCFFEWIYFGHLASVIDGESTYRVRERIGEELAKEETLQLEENGWIVVPVPESSYVAGAKYAQVTGVPFVQGLLKNHSVGRTFIDNTNRQHNISLKFTHLKEIIRW